MAYCICQFNSFLLGTFCSQAKGKGGKARAPDCSSHWAQIRPVAKNGNLGPERDPSVVLPKHPHLNARRHSCEKRFGDLFQYCGNHTGAKSHAPLLDRKGNLQNARLRPSLVCCKMLQLSTCGAWAQKAPYIRNWASPSTSPGAFS